MTNVGNGYQDPVKLKTKGVEAVDKALRILSLFSAENSRLSLGEISERTGLVKSSVLRLLISLQNAGYLAATPDKHYAIGPEAFRVGNIYQQTFSLENVIRPALKKLVAHSGESASFFRREGRMRVCVYREDSTQPLREHVAEGDAVEIGKGAAGHVFVDYHDMRGDEPAPLDVLEELPVVSIGERGPGIAGISLPLFNTDGDLLGALALSGPSTRFTEDRVREMLALIMAAAATIGDDLGSKFYRDWPMRL